MFVSFSGVDGAGKSTQIAALRNWLEAQGLRVTAITFWGNIATLTGIREGAGHKIFKGEKGVGSPEAPVNRRDKNVQSWQMTCVRFCLYALDAVSTRIHVKRALDGDADCIIFDRYIYDQFANLRLRGRFVRAYVKALMKIVPRPDISYVLDADPHAARARKPEYPLDFILSILPPAMTAINGAAEKLPGLPPFDINLIPHPQTIARQQHPNISITTDDGKKVRSETRAGY
jgi:thymidylate kinase